MAKSSNQKMKILFLLRLFQDAGENQVYSMQSVIDLLAAQGIQAERKSIYDDLEVLRQFGMDIRFRKERPSGYYLAGSSKDFSEAELPILRPAGDGNLPSAPEPEIRIVKEVVREQVVVPGFPDWVQEKNGTPREVKLQCSEKGREAAQKFLGEGCTVKEKENGVCLVTATAEMGPSFYGWLTVMAEEVRLVKPRREAAAYREYLKSIVKDYKAIVQ